MKPDRVIRDLLASVRKILEGLDNNLTARDNFAPESIAPHVDPVTATPEQIANALIAAGLMKAEP